MTTKNKIKLLQVLCLLTIAWLIFLILTSCEQENKGSKAPETKRFELDSTSRYWDQNYKVYTLEGCEYIAVGSGKERWGSHKGNCKNPIHSSKEEYEIDSTLFTEKHFDCYVEDCEFEADSKLYLITTECGIQYYDRVKRSKKEVLKNFESPKHK